MPAADRPIRPASRTALIAGVGIDLDSISPATSSSMSPAAKSTRVTVITSLAAVTAVGCQPGPA